MGVDALVGVGVEAFVGVGTEAFVGVGVGVGVGDLAEVGVLVGVSLLGPLCWYGTVPTHPSGREPPEKPHLQNVIRAQMYQGKSTDSSFPKNHRGIQFQQDMKQKRSMKDRNTSQIQKKKCNIVPELDSSSPKH